MYIILGCGTAGLYAASSLQEKGKELTIVDHNKERLEALKDRGFKSMVFGDMTKPSVLKEVGIKDADSVLILTTDVKLNIEASKTVRKISKDVPIILRAGKESNPDDFLNLGIDDIIYPTTVVADNAIEILGKIEIKRKLNRIKEIISRATKEVAIVLQDNPDPDAIASGITLKRIIEKEGKKADIFYGGEIGHEENRAMVNLMGLNLMHISSIKDIRDYPIIALIEATHPGENNSLPKNVTPNIVIDHHPSDLSQIKSEFYDIRPNVGANSSILAEYLIGLDMEITEDLATLLLYGIKSDTNNFTRGTTPEDLEAVAVVYPKANHDLMSKIETPLMSGETLDVLGQAIRNRKVMGSIMLTNVGFIHDRDTLPQAADYLLKLEGISTVLVYGLGKDVVHISGRNKDIRIHLGDSMSKAFGNIGQAGGHSTAAAAKVSLGLFGGVKDKDALLKLAEEAISDRFLGLVGAKAQNSKD